jgi:hypothetical protein
VSTSADPLPAARFGGDQAEDRAERIAGTFLVIGVVAFFVAGTALSASFDWPDILRESPKHILTEFEDGGQSLVWNWFAVAWSYGLLLIPVLLLHGIFVRWDGNRPWSGPAAVIGAIAVTLSVVGFMRWVLVVPELSERFAAGGVEAQPAEAAFVAQHQYGGAVVGEHVGQILSLLWSGLVSVMMLNSRRFPRWLGWFGLIASVAYLLNQGDVLATGFDDFPELDIAGVVGSTLWALWLLAVGVVLLRRPRADPRMPQSWQHQSTPA